MVYQEAILEDREARFDDRKAVFDEREAMFDFRVCLGVHTIRMGGCDQCHRVTQTQLSL